MVGAGSMLVSASRFAFAAVIDEQLITTALVVVVALVLVVAGSPMVSSRTKDPYRRYYLRKTIRYVVVSVALVALGIVWRPFAGQLGLLLGLLAAGLVVALQDVIGAFAGWFSIFSGGVFRVGDRVQLGGVDGDVIDISPLRTKLMEIGTDVESGGWVRGRQYTGRIVSVSNKASFTAPVYNYSGVFEFIWEELTFPISFRDDWRAAERIVADEIQRVSTEAGAREAILEMSRRFPMPSQELEPRVYIRVTDNYLELAGRFLVPVRTSRTVKDVVTRRILERLEEAGIGVASTTQDVTLRRPASG